MPAMAKRKLRSDHLPFRPYADDQELQLPADARNPALDLQRMLAERLLSESEPMELVLPQRSHLASQIDSIASNASRFAGPVLLVLAGMGIASLVF
jgi:hypothetical protein